MNNNKKHKTTTQTLVEIYHPDFRQGYQAGRQHYFREQGTVTDKELVACLESIFEESKRDEVEEREGNVQHAVGFLLGQMSGRVVPHQAYEEKAEEVQEAFLHGLAQRHGESGASLVSTIRHFWVIQDQLAQTLDTDTFDKMLQRGAEIEV